MAIHRAPTPGAMVAVRLTDVPVEIRRAAARRLLDAAANRGSLDLLDGAVDLWIAAERPSDIPYRVPLDAYLSASATWRPSHDPDGVTP